MLSLQSKQQYSPALCAVRGEQGELHRKIAKEKPMHFQAVELCREAAGAFAESRGGR